MQRIKKWVGIALISGCGLSVADASCTLSLCREKGHGYDCHSVTDSPEWVCRQAQTAATPASTTASTSTHTPSSGHAKSSTTPVPIQAPVSIPEPDLFPELAPELEPAQPTTTLVPPAQ